MNRCSEEKKGVNSSTHIHHYILAGRWCHQTILKNIVRQWVLDDIPYMKWKITFMLQTTKQLGLDVTFLNIAVALFGN